MPELVFKGKEFVHNHHLSVPYRPLLPDPSRSVGEAGLGGNLIIHGDNLHALKALLPVYAGKVDCVFIDPPYNTGNENWSYNDNVNSPIMKEWLNGNPVNKEDMLRHDKWLCMMYPRIRLLLELLSESGVIAVTIDDNEVHSLRNLLDDIFSKNGFIASFVWRRRIGSSMSKDWVSSDHEYVVVYSKSFNDIAILGEERDMSKYNILDGEGRKYASMPLTVGMTKEMRPNQWYELINPKSGKGYWPPNGRVWGYYPPTMKDKTNSNLIIWPDDYPEKKMTTPRLKTYPEDAKRDRKPTSTWLEDIGRNEEGTRLLKEIFNDSVFNYPKPLPLVQKIVEQFCPVGGLVLDSFAGSGTTAHAVLAANAKDNGSRRFILVECEDYADTLTAERVRRVINGYSFTGKQTEELFSEKITFTSLKKSAEILRKVEGIEQLHGHRFDAITKKVSDGLLTVCGEKAVASRTEGLGGSFTYCTLGDPLDIDGMLTGANLPSYAALGAWLFHTATGQALDPSQTVESDWYLGRSTSHHVWLIYAPDLDFLTSNASALTLDRANGFSLSKPDMPHLVFAPSRFVASRDLKDLRVEFSPLPYALYRLERG